MRCWLVSVEIQYIFFNNPQSSLIRSTWFHKADPSSKGLTDP